MADPKRRTARLISGAAVAAALASAAAPGAERTAGIDWNAVGRAIGRPLTTEAQDVHTAEWLRTDLHVVDGDLAPRLRVGLQPR